GLLAPSHDLGDDTFREAGDVKLRRRGSAQIMEVQLLDSRDHLRAHEHGRETTRLPRPPFAMDQHGGGALRHGAEQVAQVVVQRDDGLTPSHALARWDDYGVGADVRPAQANEVAQAQAGVRGKVRRLSYLGRARGL